MVSQVIEASQLEVGPLLLNFLDLAIDVLLDLLLLSVHFDELAGTDSMMVGVESSAALNDLEDGPGIGSRIGDEAVLGLGVASRNGFAGDLLVARSLDSERRLAHLVQRHNARCPVSHLECAVATEQTRKLVKVEV